MKYAVVVVTYNRLSLLKECLDCINKQSYGADEIIIVNNASTDGTEDYLKTIKDDRLKVLNQKENLGGAGGFKVGIEYASESDCDYVLIIDDDAMISENFLEECNRYLIEHQDCRAVSGTVKTNGEIQLNHRRIIANKLVFFEKNVAEEDYRRDTFEYDLSTFCGLVVKKDVIKEIGLPKSEYFIWYDDSEYSMRIGKIININAAELNHKTKITQTNSGFFERMNWRTYYGHRNRYDMVRNHCGTATRIAVWLEFTAFKIGAFFACREAKRRRYIIKMLNSARKDALDGKLGINPNYYFN